ncbi:MAG: citramalate synthase [Chloroflexi bacterium]|nr:citramalate synthase [Chloroflexota bacterium]
MGRYPKIEYLEQVMRDGLQIEDASISVDDKLRLLDAVGETGLNYIEVGSFVSPKWTPQMACIDELMQRFVPKPGVKYVALTMNERGLERARQYCPPLTIKEEIPTMRYWLCDVFARRNINRSQEQLIAAWPATVARAKGKGAAEAGIFLGAAWGSNWLGEFSLADQMGALEQEHRVWDEAGIAVTRFGAADPMSWATPNRVEETLTAIKEKWPDIRYFHLHLHDARGLALTNIYAALRVLGPEDTLLLEGTIGGIGGCPYCGNGRAAGMAPTEDLLHMLEGMGIDTGVDMDKLIDCVWLLEEIIGRPTPGHVSKAGPRPMTRDRWYPMDLPFIETQEQAKHFKLGQDVYEGCIRPWREPIRSPMRPEE